ncbi:MAG: hypothetical protein ABIT07_10935 [Ferruginibacter sp.]
MKKWLLYCLLGFSLNCQGQLAPLDIVEAVNLPKKNFDNYITKKGFALSRTSALGDTLVNSYNYIGSKKNKHPDSVKRELISVTSQLNFSLKYLTYSEQEYLKKKNQLKAEGFICNREKDSLNANPLLFQSKNITVLISAVPRDSLTAYTFLIKKQSLPKPEEIIYAEDLAAFNSHEYLRYYFGDKNVKKDIYYLSENQLAKCSILFPNTNRQVVFLWGDEPNNCNLLKMYIGGQLQAESSLEYDRVVSENLWQLKCGIHAGMSLYALRQLNEKAFSFYAGNSANTGVILPDNDGKLDFKKSGVILGCMNCTDADYYKKSIINTDDALKQGRMLFVHTIIISLPNRPS